MLKYMEVAESSEQRREREKATSRDRHGLAASPHRLAWRGGGGFSDRFTAEFLFKDPKKHYKEKAGETGMKEAELAQGVALACVLDAHDKIGVQKSF